MSNFKQIGKSTIKKDTADKLAKETGGEVHSIEVAGKIRYFVFMRVEESKSK